MSNNEFWNNQTGGTRPTAPSSPLAAKARKAKDAREDWPFATLECGHSFAVQFNEIKFETLKPLCSKMSKKFGRQFRAIKHEKCYEVARIA